MNYIRNQIDINNLVMRKKRKMNSNMTTSNN